MKFFIVAAVLWSGQLAGRAKAAGKMSQESRTQFLRLRDEAALNYFHSLIPRYRSLDSRGQMISAPTDRSYLKEPVAWWNSYENKFSGIG